VTLSKLIVPFLRDSIVRHELGHRVSGIHLVDEVMLEKDLDTQFDEPGAYLKRFQAAAREAIAAGADAIIPAEAMLATIVAVNGLRSVDDVPIIDGVGVPILQAECAIRMKQRLGIEQSRKLAYTRPSAAAFKALYANR
jgi:Asp/Glu/hydantoin racemase